MSKRIWSQHRPCCCLLQLWDWPGHWVVGYLLFPADFSIISISLIIPWFSPCSARSRCTGRWPGSWWRRRVRTWRWCAGACLRTEIILQWSAAVIISLRSHIVLQVRLAAIEEQHTAGLVVSILTAEVKRREPAPVLDVEICFWFAQNWHSLTETLPSRLVKRRVPVLKWWSKFTKTQKSNNSKTQVDDGT